EQSKPAAPSLEYQFRPTASPTPAAARPLPARGTAAVTGNHPSIRSITPVNQFRMRYPAVGRHRTFPPPIVIGIPLDYLQASPVYQAATNSGCRAPLSSLHQTASLLSDFRSESPAQKGGTSCLQFLTSQVRATPQACPTCWPINSLNRRHRAAVIHECSFQIKSLPPLCLTSVMASSQWVKSATVTSLRLTRRGCS